ncbi:isoleucine--tRNA ligase [Pelagibacterales bacterium SAG-MED25]|uniref:isoleucine--tRNA ligase n=1 Tax=Pelagibacter sp. (strain HTCC7211) TaxID=439493 RepID=UPI00054ED882|nr:isoleucine--tRNA ligase [Candidatus Pelagibacter sp. HTCC7211]MBD1150777.1 isoleucine--tRNA ligase [Pelagibacterales bacterium SAG-MED25]
MSKSQINLPKTAFSMKANLPVREPEILEYWNKINLYDELRNSSKGKEKFVLHDGPPYANGNIHMGTALNKILKDIIVKFHQMDGKDSIYVPGWDCHGLPIEWKIEEQYKKNKKNKNEVPIVEFRKECRSFAEKWIEVHKSQFKRLGVIGDWENYYSTMSFDAEAQIVRELGKFLKEGSLYRGFKPVLWSTVEKTALADAEVEYQDHKSDTIYTSFPVKSSNIKELEGSEVVIWTTTPWTIPANKALAYNQSLDYVLIQLNDEGDFQNRKIVIAEALLESVIKDCSIENYQEIKKFKGKDLKDTICKHPFFNLGYEYDIPMLEARFVTTEQGTGIVHCAPSHGPDDFNLCLNNGIKAIETVDGDGKYTSNVQLFEGNHIFKANPIVIEKLKEQKKLLSNGELIHSYPHSWRSKAPLVHRATPQWFISMESHKLREIALKALDETTFYPSKGKERLRSMIETRPDWCVSRQRVWGVPLPIFVNKKTKEILVDDEVNETIANIYEIEGSDCWFSDDPQRFLGKKYKSEDYEKLSDIVEVWFDSGSTHSFVLEKREDLKWPASMYLEGSDQHRGWFHSSLLESCGTRGRAPFESILSHGFVVDGKGLKMSKSLGNVIAPEDILKKYGADILRIWVASSNYAEDLRIDHSILDQHAESYRKIRNTFRYLLGNLNDNFEKIDLQKINLSELPELEKFMLHKIYVLNSNFKNYFKNYDFHNLYKELLNFCTVDLSAFYFDIRKDTLYCDPIDSKKRQSTIILLNVILNSLLRWFAPILSFTTEEIYKLIYNNNNSIHLESFLNYPEKFKNDQLNQKWIDLIKIRNICNISIEEKRASKEIGSSLEAKLKINLDKKLSKITENIDFSELCITSSSEVIFNKNIEISAETTKAKGTKCPVCWKITEEACSRKTCPKHFE